MRKRLLSECLFIAFVCFVLSGCSGLNSPVSTSENIDFNFSYGALPVFVSERFPDGRIAGGTGILGLFNLSFDISKMSAEIISLRKASSTDVLETVDITNFLQLAPCIDCVKIKSIARDNDGYAVLSIGIKHPFRVGDPLKPITGRNRADLHVFNVEGIVISNTSGINFSDLKESVSGLKLINADGYTGYLDKSLDVIFPTEATIHPYILHFDDYSSGNYDPINPMGFASVTDPPPSGNLVMAMGCDYDYQDYVFDLGTDGPNVYQYIFAVGCTYGVSADTKNQRFNPVYRVPQHNKKAASEIKFKVVSNHLRRGDISSSAHVEIQVVDINHGVQVGSALNQMLADSSVKEIIIELPGVMNSNLIIDGNASVSGTGHSPSDPLVYQGVITNSAGAHEGEYTGLIKVIDSYSPHQNTSPLLNGKDGIERVDPLANPLTGVFDIDEFCTYQIFNIQVNIGGDAPVVLSINPSEGVLNCVLDDVLITGENFDSDAQVTFVKSTGGTPIDALNEIVDPAGTSLTCTIDLNPMYFTDGLYDVVVTNPTSNLSGTLDEGFTVLKDLNIEFVDPIQLFNHPTWDEFSPCIAQDTTGQIIAFWHAHQPYPSIDIPGRSYDGINWTGGTNVFGSTCTNCRSDTLKIAPRSTTGVFVLIRSTFASTSVFCATDYGAFSAPYCFNYPKCTYNLEMMSDPMGYGYGCGDLNGQIVFQKTPTPNVPDNSPNYPIAPGRLSHVRSWGYDSGGILYLAFLDTGATKILLSRGTDSTNLLWTTPMTVFESADYDDVRDPSVHIVNDVIHMSFLRHNKTSGNYELCYTRANVNDLNFTEPLVADTSSAPYEDAHIQYGKYYDVPVILIAYQNASTVFLTYSTCGGKTWHTPIVVQTVFSQTEDCDMILLNHTASLNEDFIIIWAQMNAQGKRDIITRMGHFTR